MMHHIANLPSAKTHLKLALAADLHYYPAQLTGNYNQVFKDDNYDLGKPAEQSEGILLSALESLKARAKRDGLDYLILAGDLTRDGEHEAHVRLAALLERFQRESGVRVLLIPGNHDLNNPDAAEYIAGVKAPARRTTPAEFLEIYQNLRPAGCNISPVNPCSYAFDLNEGYRLIAIDTCKYDDRGNVLVRGEISPPQMAWVLSECAKANQAGKIILGLLHHNLAEQVGYQDAFFKGYMLDDYIYIREKLADAGMRFCFSGHMHRGGAAEAVSDSGGLLYDICAPALCAFPSELQSVNFTRSGKKATAQITAFPADEALPVAAAGKIYTQPYYKENFKLTFGGSRGGGFTGFLQANLKLRLTPILEEIQAAGGLKTWLAQNGMQLDSPLLNALFAQLDARYINDPAHTVKLACKLLEEAMGHQLSELPSRQFLKELGIGHKKRPGTIRDAMECMLAVIYWKGSLHGDPFMEDALHKIRSGRFVDQALRFVIDKLVDDLLAKELLPQLKLRLGRKTGRHAKLALQTALGLFIDLKKRRAISRSLEWLVLEFLNKPNTRETTLVHKGRVRAKANDCEFRKPIDMQVRLGKNKDAAALTWYTKASVTASDVVVYDSEMRRVRGLKMHKKIAHEPCTARKLDIGMAKIMGHEIPAAKHSVIITGLKPGRYIFRAGDKSRGWLSPAAAMNTGETSKPARALHQCRSTARAASKLIYSFRLVNKT